MGSITLKEVIFNFFIIVLEKSINCPPTDLALHSEDTLN